MDKQSIDIAKRCVELALKSGARQAEVFMENGRNMDVTARDGEVETIKQAESLGMGLRIFSGKRLGFGYTSDLSANSLPSFVKSVMDMSKITSEDEFNDLPPVEMLKNRAPAPETYDKNITVLTPEWAVKTSVEMEKMCKAYDPRIKTVSNVGAGTYVSQVAIVNSLGLEDFGQSTYVWVYAGPVATDKDGNSQVAYYWDERCFASDMTAPEAIAKEAAKRAVDSLGSDKIPSGVMPVIFHPDMTKGFISGLVGAVNGDMVFKNASFLSDKLGAKIASDKITIIDDPLKIRGVASSAFDGEGVPKRKLTIFDKGELKLFLYDAYTAAKAGALTTASAVRGYSSLPSIGVSNLMLESRDQSPEKIIGEVKYGLYVTRMMGRGVNTVTGDYSRGAKGFLIENGELTKPVQEVTVAAHMNDMLMGIDAVGNDLDLRGSTNAPTIRFAELTVSGK
jgi:PmbA protein